jgi:acyl-CoA thioesterase-1
MGRKYLIGLILPLLAITSSSIAQGKIRIACVGNSITFGAKTTDPATQSYPAILNSLLLKKGYRNYDVKNFGISGATMLHYGQPNMWAELDSVRNNVPGILIIEAGTNETASKPRYNWGHIVDFEKDYTEFLAVVRKVNPDCKIILCSPLDMVLKTNGLVPERLSDLTARRPRIWQLRKRIKLIAKHNRTYFLDLTEAFKNKADLMSEGDGVHPSVDGYSYLGKKVFDYLQQQRLISTDKI